MCFVVRITLGVFCGKNNVGCWVCFMVRIMLGVFHGKNNVGCVSW